MAHCSFPMQQAGIYPTYEQIDHFSHLLPGASFLDILTLFFKMAQIGGTFFLCNVQKQLDIASALKNVRLSLHDMYKLTLAPVEKDYNMDVLKEVCTIITYNYKCNLLCFCEKDNNKLYAYPIE